MSHSHTFQDDHCRKEVLVQPFLREGKGPESKFFCFNLEQDLVSASGMLVRSGASILPVEKTALVRECVRHSRIVPGLKQVSQTRVSATSITIPISCSDADRRTGRVEYFDKFYKSFIF